jgi:hypothetical protein
MDTPQSKRRRERIKDQPPGQRNPFRSLWTLRRIIDRSCGVKLRPLVRLHRLLICAGAALLLALPGLSQAAPFEFANFNLLNANQPFSFTNNGGTSGTISAVSAPMTFNFTTQSGLSTADHQATLTITSGPGVPSTFVPATSLGALVDQPITTLTTLTITENGTGLNLLTMIFNGDIVGRSGGPNADLSGADSTGQIVLFSSAFGLFGPTGNSFDLGLATISPALSIGPGGFLNTFASNIDGQFTANFAVPEPGSSVLLLATGLTALGLVAVRRKTSV